MWSVYFPDVKHVCAKWRPVYQHIVGIPMGINSAALITDLFLLFWQFQKSSSTSQLLTQGSRYHKLRKIFGKFLRSYSKLMSKFGAKSFQENISEGIFHPVFYGDLAYKLKTIKGKANFVSSGSKIVKRLRRRKYDPVIIEETVGFALDPSTPLYRSFLQHSTVTNKAVVTIWQDLSKLPQRKESPDPHPLWLSRFFHPLDLSSLPDGQSIAYSTHLSLQLLQLIGR